MVTKIYVTKGLIRYKDKYLFIKKIKDVIPENIGKWECSGGQVSENEDPKLALLKEIREETGLNAKVIKELPFLSIKTDKFESNCHIFLLEVNIDQVKLSEGHSDFVWVKAEEVKNLDLVLFASLLLEYFNNPNEYLK